MAKQKVLLAHGSGGEMTHRLIRDLLLKKLNNPILKELSDSAVVYQDRLAFTTDSFVVSPLRFPGADIGKLAICGTINDLVVQGASAEYLSLALIIEEGLDYGILEKIVDSLAKTARSAKVRIVTGDIKVVEHGAADKIFINTSGVGRVVRRLALKNIRAGDKIILTGNIGQHGLAVLAKRKDLNLGFSIKSDCAALNSLLIPILKKTSGIKFMRDPTRGGLATTLNEITRATNLGAIIEEKNIPLSRQVKAAAELLGIDPLYVACEGRAVIVASPQAAGKVLASLRKHSLGRQAQEIGRVVEQNKGQVVLRTVIGTERIIDMLSADPLPRIC